MSRLGLSAWARRVEAAAIHPALAADPGQFAKARLYLWLCVTAGPALLAVILAWAILDGALFHGAIVAVGHTLTISAAFSLRYCTTMRVPARLITILAVLQLTSAAWWTGGLGSIVVGTFPVATVFLGFIDDLRNTLLGWLGLSLGVLFLVLAPAAGFQPGPPAAPAWVLGVVALWSVSTGLGVALVHQRLTDRHLQRVSAELEMRTRAQAEAERVRDQWQGFVRYVSHELRNPLTTIAGNLEVHALTRDPDRRAQYLRSVELASNRLVRLADDVLDFSTLEQGKLKVRAQHVELGSVCRSCLDELRGEAAFEGQRVELHAPAPVFAQADPDRVIQTVSNLVLNALKYAEGAPVEVSVGASGGQPWVRISDAGPGIAAELHPHLFEPFSRAGTARRKGNGLGLSIARNLARSMGGDLVLLERAQPGAHFELTLPPSEAAPEA